MPACPHPPLLVHPWPPPPPQALSQFGTDFTLIAHLFPGRQRRHLKNKFTRESRVDPPRVDAAIRASANATITSYQEMISMLKAGGLSVGGEDEAEPAAPEAEPAALPAPEAEAEAEPQQEQQQQQQQQEQAAAEEDEEDDEVLPEAEGPSDFFGQPDPDDDGPVF